MTKTKQAPAGGDAPVEKKKEEKPEEKQNKKQQVEEEESVHKSPSMIAKEEAEFRAMLRKTRFKRRWPEITKVKVNTKPWHPPLPPQKVPPVMVEMPPLTTRHWVPPYRRRRRPRPKMLRIPAEELTKPLEYENNKLRKIWHNFSQVEKNKMMLQGSIGCNSKKYSATACGAQTGCIAAVCKALLEEKTPAELVRRDVDECIACGDSYYKRCMVAMKCYKGKPQLQLHQLLTSFFLHDTKYTVKMSTIDRGLLAKHPDSVTTELDLMTLMEKRVGQTYSMILTIGDEQHFLIWGHPPKEASGNVKTVAYMFDPHMLDGTGKPHKLFGAGGILRFAGISSFVLDFLTNYGHLDSSKKGTNTPSITLTSIEVVQKEPLERQPFYDLDLKAMKTHCQDQWDKMNVNALIDKKRYEGKYPLCSLSAVSLATSKATSRKKVHDFYQKTPKEPLPTMPVPPERGPGAITTENLMTMRGEDFFLYCPKTDGHTFGRDDLIPLPKSETILHSPVDVADKNFHSQYKQLDAEKFLLRGTRHMASYRYQTFKSYTAIACCVTALAMLGRLRSRAWNEDTIDETLDLGYNFFRDSLLERAGPIRRLVLGELKETFRIRDQEFSHKERGIAVWGKILSSNPKVFDLCRGIDQFFKESDTGVLMVPGEFEAAIWNEGGKYYLYHPWPADRYGKRVGLQDGGKACCLYFTRCQRLCDHLLTSLSDLTRRPFSISDVMITKRSKDMPEPVNNLTPVAPGRWVVRGTFHEGDTRFPEEHRNRQSTPVSIVALAMAHIRDPNEWTPADVDDILVRGDILYQNTIEHLEKMGISLDAPPTEDVSDSEQESDSEDRSMKSGMLPPADVMNKFTITDEDCIETEITDNAYTGSLNPEPGSGLASLKNSLRSLFSSYSHGIVTCRGCTYAVWRSGDNYYMFEPRGCDENGYPSDEPRSASCMIKVSDNVAALADAIMSNLVPNIDNIFNISPVTISHARLRPELAAPETKLESKAFVWINKGTAAIMMGPRGENTAIGKIATKAGIGEDDQAGRTLALPAAAAFAASTDAVPPQYMHQDHMFNFLDAGAEYYLNHVKKTGRKEILPEDLTEKFEMGANTFSIELGEPIKLPLRLPDEPAGEGEEESDERELGEEEEEPTEVMKQIKDALFKIWHDHTKPSTISLLYGDYHQMGVWMSPGGKVVVFDPAPTLTKGLLTSHRIVKGDELRLQRIKDEMSGEDAAEGGEDEELGGEGEEKPEPIPEPVPPDSCPALMIFASPGEFIDKLVLQGGLDRKQCLAPYKLYPVSITNELTSVLKDTRSAPAGNGEEEEETEVLVEALDDAAVGSHFNRISRTTASLRGRVAQDENYFMDTQRNLQDAAMAVMGIVVDHIEPYIHWKPQLIDAIEKYGDRLYTLSLSNAVEPPNLRTEEVSDTFRVTNFNIKIEKGADTVTGDLNAGDTGTVLNLVRAIKKFFETNKHGVLCAKNYCVGLWRAADDKAYVLWEPHSVGPAGRTSSGGAAGAILYSIPELLSEAFVENVKGLARPGGNNFTITPIKVFWEFSRTAQGVTQQGAVPDEGYEWKVLTAFVETARGRTILRGSRPADLIKFTRDTLIQSSCGAIVACCMSHVRRPHLWTRNTVDEVVTTGCQLFMASLGALGYEFRPGEDLLLPLQVLKRFLLGVNYIRYDLQQVFSGKLEQKEPSAITVRAALERFFETHTHGILWSAPYATAVWKVAGAPPYYMVEPHACGPTGLRIDAQEDGAACVCTFTSPKLMSYAYLQNTPTTERPRHNFQLYAMSVIVKPIKKLHPDPPLLRTCPAAGLVPATSKVNIQGDKRRAEEKDRKHPPGSTTCMDAQRASDKRDKEQNKLKGQRNTSGWLVLNDGTQYLSAHHSMCCKKFPRGSRGKQALACSVMAVAMSRVQHVCRWCSSTLEQVLEAGEQLHQDSWMHYKPKADVLNIAQILRKFYTPGNCVCRVAVFKPRHGGIVDDDLLYAMQDFFREEKMGVLVAGKGDFVVALFKTPRGYYMFDPSDRDRYGRAVAPPCFGKGRACFSQYPTVQALVEKLGPNIPPVLKEGNTSKDVSVIKQASDVSPKRDASSSKEPSSKEMSSKEPSSKEMSRGAESKDASREVRFSAMEESAPFLIFGMDVSSLRRLNQHEK